MPRTHVVALLLTCVACSGNSTRPDERTGIAGVAINCLTPVAGPLICTARATCGLYPCPGLPDDVTQLATWTSGDPGVVAPLTPGSFQATGIGHTVISADWSHDEDTQPVSVFPNTPPLPTFEIEGAVYRNGMPPNTGAISGAVVTILDGFVAGRQAITGVPPLPLPGFFTDPTLAPQRYRFLGSPAGAYRIRVTKAGYLTQERTVGQGSIADFALDPSIP